MAGALGFEPRPSVLETDVLAIEHYAPIRQGGGGGGGGEGA